MCILADHVVFVHFEMRIVKYVVLMSLLKLLVLTLMSAAILLNSLAMYDYIELSATFDLHSSALVFALIKPMWKNVNTI